MWLRLLVSASLTGSVVLAATPAGAAAPGRTDVHFVSPVTATGLAAGYRVTATTSAQCQEGSDSLDGVIYRCFAGSDIHDPCWRDPRAADRKAVVCLSEPWSRSLTALRLAAPVGAPRQLLAVERDQPWGIELADGHRCLQDQGSRDSIGPVEHGYVVNWSCSRTLALLRTLHQAQQPWTDDEAIYSRGSATVSFGPRRVPIAAVWYGVDGPASLATLPALPVTGFPTVSPLVLAMALLGIGVLTVVAARR